VTDSALIVSAGDTYVTPINRETYLNVCGDFAISAKLATNTQEFGGISFFGALPQGDWWQGIKRMDVGLVPGQVAVTIWTGASQNAVMSQGFRFIGSSSPAQVELRKVGGQFIIRVNEQEVGRVADPGLFEGGNVYLGANIAPHNQLTIYDIAAATA